MDDSPQIVVIGIGNDFRHDDAVGLEVARLVRKANLADVSVVGGVSDDYALLTAWDSRGRAFVIDCTQSYSTPGTVHRFDGLAENIPADIFSSYSTHTLNIVKTIELSRTLGRLPQQLTIIGVEGADFSHGSGLSPAVEVAAVEVVRFIISFCKSTVRVTK